eukprot:CAMPEP_0195287892 /NCGR_PEP_ID=MMETSP0707-20130614/4775_1 /TAXON_ID=33640 /ORGANISM="Asterionellopsis glacialis, Strain CCMP134" /LENGTH=330 /DNA_ID=CAMNT_0040347697 /DNA_START=69 /DNA_END=1061 /DNA_ORIENTATION=-
MGDRKVLNKYVPPDFDPALVPRGKKPKDGLVTVRMMLPFTVQCSSCSTFLYRGRKFNSKKEAMGGPNGKYLGIQRFRFYIKCTACSRPVTFLTDPQNADYEMESGGTRNYEVFKDKAKTEENFEKEQEQEEKDDPMKGLENRVLESKREMEDLDNLEEIKAMNMKHVQLMSKSKEKGVGFGDEAKAVLMAREAQKQQQQHLAGQEDLNEHGLTENEEALVKGIKFGQKSANSIPTAKIRRLNEDDEKMVEERRRKEAAILEKQQADLLARAKKTAAVVPIIKAKRRRVEQKTVVKKAKVQEEKKRDDGSDIGGGGLSGLLGGYDSDSDSD